MEYLLKVEGKIRIERIDRKTGRTIESREIDNAITPFGASHIRFLSYKVDPTICSVGTSFYVANKLILMDANRVYIKELPNGSYAESDSGSAMVVTLTWEDTSPDSYSVSVLGLARAGNTFSGTVNVNNALLHAVSISPALSKLSSDTVKYTWTINIQYTIV